MLKQAAEALLAHSGAAALAARRRRGSTLVLAYHNIVPDDAPPTGDRSLHLPLTQFRSQLDRLQETHEVVDLSSIRDGGAVSGKPRVCITFDDAYHGALALALPELARRQLPATVFVAPGLLGNQGCWWDLLAAADGTGLPQSVREHVLDALGGDGAAAVEWARSQGLAPARLPSYAVIATEGELRAAAALPGTTLGAHTWSHCNLAKVNDAAFETEFVKPLDWLRERFERVLPWLAYPYGRSTLGTADIAARAGYRSALRIEGGWVPAGSTKAFTLPRLNVPSGLSLEGFILRVSGLIGK